MQKNCIKRQQSSWSKRVRIKKQKQCKRKPKKKAKKSRTAVQKKKNMQKNMHMHNQFSHTILCDFFALFFSLFVRFLCVFFHFCAFSQGNAQKMQKKQTQKNANTQQNKCKGKDQNVFDRICFAF